MIVIRAPTLILGMSRRCKTGDLGTSPMWNTSVMSSRYVYVFHRTRWCVMSIFINLAGTRDGILRGAAQKKKGAKKGASSL